MLSVYVERRKNAALTAAALLLWCLSLVGCTTSTAGSSPMDARAEGPAPQKGGYLPVEDLPPKDETTTMTVGERLKLQKELIAARDHQASRAKTKSGTAGAQSTKP